MVTAWDIQVDFCCVQSQCVWKSQGPLHSPHVQACGGAISIMHVNRILYHSLPLTPAAYFATNQTWCLTPPSGSHCKRFDGIEIGPIVIHYSFHRMKPLLHYGHIGSWSFLKFSFLVLWWTSVRNLQHSCLLWNQLHNNQEIAAYGKSNEEHAMTIWVMNTPVCSELLSTPAAGNLFHCSLRLSIVEVDFKQYTLVSLRAHNLYSNLINFPQINDKQNMSRSTHHWNVLLTTKSQRPILRTPIFSDRSNHTWSWTSRLLTLVSDKKDQDRTVSSKHRRNGR
jgi:hypothetical protein